MEGWVDIDTAVVKARSPCQRLHIAETVVKTQLPAAWFEPWSSHTTVRRAKHSATATYKRRDEQTERFRYTADPAAYYANSVNK